MMKIVKLNIDLYLTEWYLKYLPLGSHTKLYIHIFFQINSTYCIVLQPRSGTTNAPARKAVGTTSSSQNHSPRPLCQPVGGGEEAT